METNKRQRKLKFGGMTTKESGQNEYNPTTAATNNECN